MAAEAMNEQGDGPFFVKDGVFMNRPGSENLSKGRLYIKQKQQGNHCGLFVEWEPVMQTRYSLEQQHHGDRDDWAVIEAGGSTAASPTVASVAYNRREPPPPPAEPMAQSISFELEELRSFKRSQLRRSHGWEQVTFILRDGTTYSPLIFQKGGVDVYMRELERYVTVRPSQRERHLYVVGSKSEEQLQTSLKALGMYEEGSKEDVITKFMHNPYRTTMVVFSKVPNILADLIAPPETQPVEELADAIANDKFKLDIDHIEEPGYELVTTCFDLPERRPCPRGRPVTRDVWTRHFDAEGRLLDFPSLKEKIFRGGLAPELRPEAWKYLLDYYPAEATQRAREDVRLEKVDAYFRMKLQWKTMDERQETNFQAFHDRKQLIDKDVNRTDRTLAFFEGDDNANIGLLHDILMTYVMYNFDLGYVQGMSDLLAPILMVMENEVDAFWTFAGFMDRVGRNFEMNQEAMRTQLGMLRSLLRLLDHRLFTYLESKDSGNMYFCFRWLLIMFKREFVMDDVMRLWEVFWTGLPCANFHLLYSLAILDGVKETIMQNKFGLTEILKHINDMNQQIDAEQTMCCAEGMFHQVLEYSRGEQARHNTHIDKVKSILGLPD